MDNYSDELVKSLTNLIKDHDRKLLISSIAERQKKEKEQSGDMMNTDEISKKAVDFSSTAMDFCKKALEVQMEDLENIMIVLNQRKVRKNEDNSRSNS